MSNHVLNSDEEILNHIRRIGASRVGELVDEMGVTATAVRQRLNRLMAEGLIERESSQASRGRPHHRYSLTKKGARQAGTGYAELALVLWDELRSIGDPDVRRGLLKRIASRMLPHYNKQVSGDTMNDRVASLASSLRERNLPFELDDSGGLPVLTALACPYPDLAEQDRGICAMEKMLFSEIVGSNMQLTSCRLDGANCCTFQSSEN